MVFSLFAIYTCNLVAAYIIPSVFFHFLKILLGEANFRYTTTFSREYRTSVLNSLVFNFLVSPESHFRYTTIFSREFSTSVLNR